MKKMRVTKCNKMQRWLEATQRLKRWEIRLIELRNAGQSYNEIRDVLQVEFPKQKRGFSRNDQLRRLLHSRGRLHNQYLIYSEMVADEHLTQGRLIIGNLHKRAAMTLGNLLSPQYPANVRLSAAIYIIDRNAGKPTQKIDMPNNEKIEELRKKIAKLSEPDENTKKLSRAIKNKARKK